MQQHSDPKSSLVPWIARYWSWQISAGGILPDLLPGTGGELLFNLGDPLHFSTVPLATKTTADGLMTDCLITDCLITDRIIVPKGKAVLLRPRKARLTLSATGEVDILSIRLRSATCFPLLGVALDELDEAPVPLTDLGLAFPVAGLVELAYQARISLIEQWLLTLLNRCYVADPAMVWAVDRLYYGDDPLTIHNQLGLSERTMQRRIRQFTGVDARYFCRTARFQRTLRQLLAEQPRLYSQINHDYCDQSHFIKTCRLFTGLTPSALLTAQYRQLNYYSLPQVAPTIKHR